MFTFFVAISDLYISCRNISPFFPNRLHQHDQRMRRQQHRMRRDIMTSRSAVPPHLPPLVLPCHVLQGSQGSHAQVPPLPNKADIFAFFYLHFRIRGYLDFFCRVLRAYKVEVSKVSSRTFFHKEHPRRSMTCQSFAKVISRKLWN